MKSINEHINRIKFLFEYDTKNPINENQFIQEDDFDANLEKEITLALNQTLNDLPNELNVIAKTTGDRDGQLELNNEVKEAVGMLAAGAVLALPEISKMVGKASEFLGKKLDNQTIQNFGQKAKVFGDRMHHKYEGFIDKLTLPFTRNIDPEKRKIINKIVFYSIVATFFGIGATGAVSAATAGNTGLAAVEGGLSSVKASELAAAAKEIIPKVISSMKMIS
jgi:hypothetical protein